MKIMIVGSGGREHALAWKLAQSDRVSKMWCTPGNGGTQGERLHSGVLVENVPIQMDNIDGLCTFANENRPDLVVVGRYKPLALGLVDRLETMGVKVFGPNQECFRFEGESDYAQEFCDAVGVPIVVGQSFDRQDQAIHCAQEIGGPCIVRSCGSTESRRVVICEDADQAGSAIREILDPRNGGSDEVFIQGHVEGEEVSFTFLCDGNMVVPFPPSKKYRRRGDDDSGLNTVGMGACAPHRRIKDLHRDQFRRNVIDVWLSGCRAIDIKYTGLISPGAVIDDEGKLHLLDFNCRFGDPDAQVYARLLISDLLPFLEAATSKGFYNSSGKLTGPHWKPGYCVCVVLVDENYPTRISEGQEITGIEEASRLRGVKIFHSGTLYSGGKYYTNGGRILSVTARGMTPDTARQLAYQAVDLIHFEGKDYRKDIAEDLCFSSIK